VLRVIFFLFLGFTISCAQDQFSASSFSQSLLSFYGSVEDLCGLVSVLVKIHLPFLFLLHLLFKQMAFQMWYFHSFSFIYFLNRSSHSSILFFFQSQSGNSFIPVKASHPFSLSCVRNNNTNENVVCWFKSYYFSTRSSLSHVNRYLVLQRYLLHWPFSLHPKYV